MKTSFYFVVYGLMMFAAACGRVNHDVTFSKPDRVQAGSTVQLVAGGGEAPYSFMILAVSEPCEKGVEVTADGVFTAPPQACSVKVRVHDADMDIGTDCDQCEVWVTVSPS